MLRLNIVFHTLCCNQLQQQSEQQVVRSAKLFQVTLILNSAEVFGTEVALRDCFN